MPQNNSPLPRSPAKERDFLTTLFGSKSRGAVLRILFGLNHDELHLNEIVRRSGLAQQGVDEQLRQLACLDLVKSRKLGNLRLYRANSANPAFVELRNLVLKSAGLRDVLAAALTSPQIEVAFVFGSIATKSERAESDVDVMIFGAPSRRDLATPLRGVCETLGREINTCVYSRAEVTSRLARRDHFLSRVLESEKLFIVGDAAGLSAFLSACSPAEDAPSGAPSP